jgi:GNAT superfamily N-acetyltransferase
MGRSIPSLRRSTANDAQFIYSLIETTMRKHVEATWGAWLPERVKGESEADAVDPLTRIVRLDGRDCGVFYVEERPTEWWVQMLFVLPEFQRRGVGKHLLDQLQRAANQAHLPVRLRVMRVNPARYYYEHLGFSGFKEDDRFVYYQRAA